MGEVLYVIGMGPGNPKLLTEEARACIVESEVLLGPDRLIESASAISLQKSIKIGCKLNEMEELIKKYSVNYRVSVLASGDTGFYSIANWIRKRFEDTIEVRYITGMSSLQYFCNQLQQPYEGIHTISVHGRENLVLGEVLAHSKVFVLTGGTYKVQDVCKMLVEQGLGEIKVSIGEHLSYPQERILKGEAKDFFNQAFNDLAVMLIERVEVSKERPVTYGLPDEAFIRGKVPMTKEEVRSVCLSKLNLLENDIIYDVGAGTGSVAIEMARLCKKGYVYALEKKAEAIELIEANKEAFDIHNMDVIRATCPEGMEALPPPDKVFIGGSSGNLKDILGVILMKNNPLTIVITAITLETLSEALNCAKRYDLELDIVQMSVASSKTIGDYHMMMGQNPIFIITMKGKVL